MNIIKFFGNTTTLQGFEEQGIPDTPCRIDLQGNQVTCWELTKDEIDEIQRTGQIWVTQRCRQVINPLEPSVFKPFVVPQDN